MTKTPEQLAEEFVAHNRSYPYDPLNAEDRYMRNSYLVGYHTAYNIAYELGFEEGLKAQKTLTYIQAEIKKNNETP